MAITYRADVGRPLTNAEVDANFAQLANGSIEGFLQSGGTARSWISKAREIVSVKDFGATGLGVADDYAAFAAAIVQAKAVGGNVYVPPGTYNLSATLLSDPAATNGSSPRLIGAGTELTVLKATHSDGPVLEVSGWFSGATDLTIDASAARTAGASGSNYGILHEPPDTASGQAKFGVYERIMVKNQPNDGIAFVSTWIGSRVSECWFNDLGGNGIIIDDGTATSRSNISRCGGVEIKNCQFTDCVGHAVRIGNDSNGILNDGYRIHVQNIDVVRCALADGVRKTAHAAWMFGRNCVVTECAFGGYDDDGDATIGGLWVAGIATHILNNRFVDVLGNAITIDRLSADIATVGIVVDEIHVLGSVQVALDPAIVVGASTVKNISLRQKNNTNITTLSTALRADCDQMFVGAYESSGTVSITGAVGVGIDKSDTTALNIAAGTTAVSSLRIAHGSAPTSPVDGDMWTTTAGLYIRINGATVGPLS